MIISILMASDFWRNHSRCERDSCYRPPRTRSCAIHHSQHNPMGMQPSRQKRNAETRVRGEGVSVFPRPTEPSLISAVLERPPPLCKTLQLLNPKHARLRHVLNRKRLHTLWILFTAADIERYPPRRQASPKGGLPGVRVRVRLAMRSASAHLPAHSHLPRRSRALCFKKQQGPALLARALAVGYGAGPSRPRYPLALVLQGLRREAELEEALGAILIFACRLSMRKFAFSRNIEGRSRSGTKRDADQNLALCRITRRLSCE